jgi:hypothetical protein
MAKNAMAAAIAATPMRPPMTPPAIAPAFELLLCEAEVVIDEPDAVLLGVKVDWKTLMDVEGTMEAVPVTSGVSGRH